MCGREGGGGGKGAVTSRRRGVAPAVLGIRPTPTGLRAAASPLAGRPAPACRLLVFGPSRYPRHATALHSPVQPVPSRPERNVTTSAMAPPALGPQAGRLRLRLRGAAAPAVESRHARPRQRRPLQQQSRAPVAAGRWPVLPLPVLNSPHRLANAALTERRCLTGRSSCVCVCPRGCARTPGGAVYPEKRAGAGGRGGAGRGRREEERRVVRLGGGERG